MYLVKRAAVSLGVGPQEPTCSRLNLTVSSVGCQDSTGCRPTGNFLPSLLPRRNCFLSLEMTGSTSEPLRLLHLEQCRLFFEVSGRHS